MPIISQLDEFQIKLITKNYYSFGYVHIQVNKDYEWLMGKSIKMDLEANSQQNRKGIEIKTSRGP